MAIIRSVERGSRDVRAHKTLVDLTYQIVSTPEGESLLHIATYGSDERKDVGTTSQSMQFDRTQAAALVGAMLTAFPGLLDA